MGGDPYMMGSMGRPMMGQIHPSMNMGMMFSQPMGTSSMGHTNGMG
jgi:hypothetical protein